MAKDDETGIDPKAIDGEPEGGWPENEIERRKALKEAREAAEEAQTGMSDRGKAGRSIDDQDPADDGDGEELFPMGSIPGDHSVTMKNIVPAGKARKAEAKMRATPIAMRDGLRRYGELVELLVTVEAGKIEEVPDLEEQDAGGRRKLVGVKDVQHFRPVHVADAAGLFSTDQVLDILEREFAIPRSADKVREVFGLEPPAAAAG
jgi:hypothetical protein